jgi:microcystin-dependent protein
MAEPFLGEIKLMSFGFPPKGWARCDGALLPINQNQALFSLLGTTFGGNGTTNFALPDLRGRVPIHAGRGHTRGERGGEQAHTLSVSELPQHTHALMASRTTGDAPAPGGRVLASNPSARYHRPTALVATRSGTVTNAGGSQAHLNMQPFLTLSFCIAIQGIFPSQN